MATLLNGCGGGEEAQTVPTVVSPTLTPTEVMVGVDFVTIAPPTAVVQQTTPPPLLPATATPPPTPIVYVIEGGDTLLGIALAENTTTEEILALNPALRPELLQIGQQIILPPPSTPIFGQAAATPLPLEIEVTQIQLYQTPSDATWILGEVHNRAPSWAENVRLAITITGPEGSRLDEAETWVAPQLIPPGGKAPFGLLWPAELPPNIQPLVSVVGGRGLAQPGDGRDNRYLELVVESADLSPAGEAIELSGRVVNIGSSTAGDLVVTASLYNGRGQLTGYVQLYLNESLAAGEQRSFTLKTTPPGGQVVEATYQVQGLLR